MLKGEGVILWPSLAEGDKHRLRNDSRSPPLTGGRESEPRWARGSSKSCSKYCSKRSPSCTLRAKPRGAGLVCSHAGAAARPSSQPALQLAARPGTFGKELQRKAATGGVLCLQDAAGQRRRKDTWAPCAVLCVGYWEVDFCLVSCWLNVYW